MSRQSTGLSRVERHFGRISDATARSGLSRSFLYGLARANPGLFKKAGAVTIADLRMLDEFLQPCPRPNWARSAANAPRTRHARRHR